MPAAPVVDLPRNRQCASVRDGGRHAAILPMAPATSANLTLTGTLAGREPEHGWAIIGASGQTARVYATGTALPGGAKLFAVYPDRVILDRNGSRESLMLPRLSGGGGANFAPRVASQAAAARAERLARRQRAAAAGAEPAGGRRPAAAATRFRRRLAARLSRVSRPQSRQFAALGLQPGDLVMAVNGAALDDPNRGLEILRGVGQGSAVTLTVERGGQQQQITIDPVTAVQELQAPPPRIPWKKRRRSMEPTEDDGRRRRTATE